MTYADLLTVFDRWLLVTDRSLLAVTVAAWIANRMPGVPVWLMLIGPPASGKTEILMSLATLSRTYPVSSIRGEAALLTAGRGEGGTGGLLREVADYGTIILKDFTTILSMNRERRSELIAALREIYDGEWTRSVGTEGGRKLTWRGRCGMLAGCTYEIEAHYSVMGAMGERWLYRRLVVADAKAQSLRALQQQHGRQGKMKQELALAMGEFVGGLDVPQEEPPLGPGEEETINQVASVAVVCRSSVTRTAKGELDNAPQPEQPARASLVLAKLYTALRVMGFDALPAYQVVRQVALDSIPRSRLDCLVALCTGPKTSRQVSMLMPIGASKDTTRRRLEDLHALGVVRPNGTDGQARVWEIASPLTTTIISSYGDESGNTFAPAASRGQHG